MSSLPPPAPRRVKLCDAELTFPSPQLQPLQSNAAELEAALQTGDWSGLRAALGRQGYVYLPQALDRGAVLAARSLVLADLERRGGILDAAAATADGVLRPGCGLECLPFLEGANALTESPTIAGVIAGSALQRILDGILQEPAITFKYKWLRTIPRGAFTGCHVDNVYMNRGSERLHTVWIPFDDATTDLGALAMCEGSHALPGFARLQSTYGQLDQERDGLAGTGWFSNDPMEVAALDPGCVWRTTDYRAGDVVLFGMHVVHASTANLTDRVRISCDVRWQPAADPVDARYMRPEEKRQAAGAWVKDDDAAAVAAAAAAGAAAAAAAAEAPPKVTISDLRRKWGI